MNIPSQIEKRIRLAIILVFISFLLLILSTAAVIFIRQQRDFEITQVVQAFQTATASASPYLEANQSATANASIRAATQTRERIEANLTASVVAVTELVARDLTATATRWTLTPSLTPSLTPTPIPSPTPVPTITPSPTPTLTPTWTPIPALCPISSLETESVRLIPARNSRSASLGAEVGELLGMLPDRSWYLVRVGSGQFWVPNGSLDLTECSGIDPLIVNNYRPELPASYLGDTFVNLVQSGWQNAGIDARANRLILEATEGRWTPSTALSTMPDSYLVEFTVAFINGGLPNRVGVNLNRTDESYYRVAIGRIVETDSSSQNSEGANCGVELSQVNSGLETSLGTGIFVCDLGNPTNPLFLEIRKQSGEFTVRVNGELQITAGIPVNHRGGVFELFIDDLGNRRPSTAYVDQVFVWALP
jgi:hypothetical protein